MSRFSKANKRGVSALNTASLPDMIFTLLFFFMIVTNMREAPHKLQFRIPDATEFQQLEKQSLVIYIFVNKEGVVQLDRSLVSMDEMDGLIAQKKSAVSVENQDRLVVSLKIDKETKMGMVNDIKKIIRDSGILMVHFATEKRKDS